MSGLNSLFLRLWYRCRGPLWVLAILLLPVSLLFYLLSGLRRAAYRWGLLSSVKIAAPLIVVGNITVGGTGKTPMVAYLVALLRRHGYRPGIISRGYGGEHTRQGPRPVSADADPREVGDEALLLARRCGCPVVVAADRVAAAQWLLQSQDCDLVISDDGLQHYRLSRDIEIIVVDGERGWGNGMLLPAGPLREPVSRLKQAALVVSTGESALAPFTQRLRLQAAVNLKNHQQIKNLEDFAEIGLVAVAGIGNPQRFFASLRSRGLSLHGVAFADHHQFTGDDLQAFMQQTILMTEKDAVKCASFASSNMWYVPVESELDPGFDQQLLQLLNAVRASKTPR